MLQSPNDLKDNDSTLALSLAAYGTWYLVPLDAFMTVVLISNYRAIAANIQFFRHLV